MYEKHPEFVEPEDPKAKIWRFMDIPKFLSMLHTKSLYFARGDSFEDPYEGMLTDFIAENMKASESGQEILNMWYQYHLNNRYDTYINCWHLNEHESAAMWKLYGALDAGIAIQSDFGAFINAISTTETPIHLGVVRYDDKHLRRETMPNGFAFWLWKRRSFEHERELRALIWRPRNNGVGTLVSKGGQLEVIGCPAADASTPQGISVEVELTSLIHRVVLSPETPDWVKEVIEEVTHRFGYSFPVEKSKLYQLSFIDT